MGAVIPAPIRDYGVYFGAGVAGAIDVEMPFILSDSDVPTAV